MHLANLKNLLKVVTLKESALIRGSLFLLVLFSFCIVLIKAFSWDELEHIHSSFLISNGQAPFIDFFQHHHGIIWYLYAPIFKLGSNISFQLILIKLISVSIGFVNLLLVYKIVIINTKNKLASIIASLIPLTSIVFPLTGIDMRPDNLMMSFVLASLYFIFVFREENTNKSLWGSGVLMGISIVFLQKSIILIPLLALVLIIENIGKFKSINLIKLVCIWSVLTVVPVLTLWLTYFFLNQWDSYYFFNWTLNSRFDDKFSVFRTLKEYPEIFYIFFVTLSINIAWAMLRWRTNRTLLSLLLITLIYILELLSIVRSPYTQYLLPLIYFVAILIGVNINSFSRRYLILTYIVILLLVAINFVAYQKFYIKDYTLKVQIEEIVKVSKTPRDKSIPLQRSLHLFEKDHEFYWFSGEAVKTIKQLDKEERVPKEVVRPE